MSSGGNETPYPANQESAVLRLRPQGYWDGMDRATVSAYSNFKCCGMY